MKLTLLAAALGAMTISLGRIPEADAYCIPPEPTVLPANGTVPPQPVLYAFIPLHRDLHAGHFVVEGAEASIEPVAETPAYDVVRIRVRARDPGHRFTVHWSPSNGSYAFGANLGRSRTSANNGHSGRRFFYKVGAAPPPNRTRVVGVTRNTFRWMCSSEDVIRLKFESTAIAYRVAWADDSTTILPGDVGALWNPYRDYGSPSRVTATELGSINCLRDSVAPEALARQRAFELYALYADGSEVRIGSSIAQLGKDGVRLPMELLSNGGKGGADEPIAPQRVISADDVWSAVMDGGTERATRAGEPPAGAPAARPHLVWSAAAGALGGAAALLGAALLRRRRRRNHEPRH
jgi:hypothetical protein